MSSRRLTSLACLPPNSKPPSRRPRYVPHSNSLSLCSPAGSFPPPRVPVPARLPYLTSHARQVLARLHHPNVVECKESFIDDRKLCIVMDYCAQGDLYQLLQKQNGRLLDEDVRPPLTTPNPPQARGVALASLVPGSAPHLSSTPVHDQQAHSAAPSLALTWHARPPHHTHSASWTCLCSSALLSNTCTTGKSSTAT